MRIKWVYIKRMLKTCLPHRKHYIQVSGHHYQSIFQRGGLPTTNLYLCLEEVFNWSWTWTGHLWEKTLKHENLASPCSLHPLLETKKCPPLWASWRRMECRAFALGRCQQRSPHRFCSLGWSYQLPGPRPPRSRKGCHQLGSKVSPA